MRTPILDRFVRHIAPQENGCWLWTAQIKRDGYGRLRDGYRMRLAHRISYELFIGPVPEETIDHLCRNRACVNPDHLESVTMRVNILRGFGIAMLHKRQTHCKNGHPFDGENTYMWHGYRHCRACNLAIKTATRRRIK